MSNSIAKISVFYIGFISVIFCSCGLLKKSQPLNLGAMIKPVPTYSVLKQEDYWIWGASMIRTEDGVCHLFFSRWPKSGPFSDWIYKSEIAYATATNPGGPYQFQRTILKGEGDNAWDKNMAHNPHIRKFGNKYYLYFISHNAKDLGLGDRQNHIFSQKIGVAVADNPAGPWKVCSKPLVDIQEGKAAHGYVTNPSVCQRPDGTFLMLFKSRPANWADSKEFIAIHCTATAPTPEGPFTIGEKPIFTKSTAEDPYLWYENKKYYAIVDDQYGNYLGQQGLALFESKNGYDWKPAQHPLVSYVQINWESQQLTKLKHLERPQLWLDQKGKPAILFCAAMEIDDKGNQNSYNVHIPLGNQTKKKK